MNASTSTSAAIPFFLFFSFFVVVFPFGFIAEFHLLDSKFLDENLR